MCNKARTTRFRLKVGSAGSAGAAPEASSSGQKLLLRKPLLLAQQPHAAAAATGCTMHAFVFVVRTRHTDGRRSLSRQQAAATFMCSHSGTLPGRKTTECRCSQTAGGTSVKSDISATTHTFYILSTSAGTADVALCLGSMAAKFFSSPTERNFKHAVGAQPQM